MGKLKVLFLSANPTATTRLRLDEEMRAISNKIRSSEYRDSIEILSAWAVRPDDLIQALNEHRPQIVHFSGHGDSSGGIILVDDTGAPKIVAPEALKVLFQVMKDDIRIAVLNACYSDVQAKTIADTIDCTIGMSDSISDEAAVIFAASFYRGIGFGRSVRESFEQGRAALLLEGIPKERTPVLLLRPGIDPSQVFVIPSSAQHPESGRKSDRDTAHVSREAYFDLEETLKAAQENEERIEEAIELLRNYAPAYSELERQAQTLDGHTLYQQGKKLIQDKEYAKAAAIWTELWKRNPRDSQCLSYLRLCFAKVERDLKVAQALSTLRAAIDMSSLPNTDDHGKILAGLVEATRSMLTSGTLTLKRYDNSSGWLQDTQKDRSVQTDDSE